MAALLGVFFLACVEKDKPEPEPIPEPEPVPQVLTAKFDQTEYFPFDAIAITLSEKATGQEYNGILGDTPVTAVRMNDTTLVVMAPDLPAGDYTLTIPISEKPNEKKLEGRLRIKPLPTVENTDSVIEEINTMFTQAIAEAKLLNDPNAALIESLVKNFNDELEKLTAAERLQFAAYWLTLSEINGVNDIELRLSLSEVSSSFRKNVDNYVLKVTTLGGAIRKFTLSGIVAYAIPNPFTIALTGYFLARLVVLARETIDAYMYIIEEPFIAVKEMLSFSQSVDYFNNRIGEIQLTSGPPYDYTLKNGESFTFNPQVKIRSITAEDYSPSAPADAKSVISSTDLFISYWNDLLDNLIKFASNLLLSGNPQSISEIKTPKKEETVTLDDFTIEIVYGEVTAQKAEANSYVFTTTETENVEFEFKVIAEDIESKVFTALLEVDMPPEITTTSLPEGKEGEPYNYTLTATGMEPITWYKDGTMPIGLSLFTETGIISGIPVETGTFTFVIRAVNDFGEDTKTFVITIKEEDDNPEETGDNWLVGTWWSSGMDASYSRDVTMTDRCGNSVEIKSQSDLRAFYENNLGVITFTSDGTFHYRVCGGSYTGMYEWDRYMRLTFSTSHPNIGCGGDFRLDFNKDLSDFALIFCTGASYRKVAGSMTKPYFSVSPSTLQIFPPTGDQMTFTVTSNTYWSFYSTGGSSDDPWHLEYPEKRINKNNGTVIVTIKPNFFWERRIANLYFNFFGSEGGLNIPITQEEAPPPVISPSHTSLNFPASGGQEEFTVTSTTNWFAGADIVDMWWINWITVSPNNGSIDGSTYVTTPITVTVEPNTGTSQRTATIHVYNIANLPVSGRTPVISVTQAGALSPGVVPALTVEPSLLNFSSSGEQKSFTVLQKFK